MKNIHTRIKDIKIFLRLRLVNNMMLRTLFSAEQYFHIIQYQ